MSTAFIILLIVAIVIDTVTLGVVLYSLKQSISNLTALRQLGMKNGRTIVAKALIRRTALQAVIVFGLAVVSSVRIWQIHNGDGIHLLGVSALFTIQILVAASAVYDVIERIHVVRWYDENPGAREYEARSVEENGVDPYNISLDK